MWPICTINGTSAAVTTRSETGALQKHPPRMQGLEIQRPAADIAPVFRITPADLISINRKRGFVRYPTRPQTDAGRGGDFEFIDGALPDHRPRVQQRLQNGRRRSFRCASVVHNPHPLRVVQPDPRGQTCRCADRQRTRKEIKTGNTGRGSAMLLRLSAFPPKADMCSALAYVR